MPESPQFARVRDARSVLLLTHPFFGLLSLRLHLEESPLVPTAGVDGKRLAFNPAFVDKLTQAELKGVVAHEVMHCGLLHHARMGDRDHRRWNVACISEATSILLYDGSEKPAGAIVEGDILWSPTGPSRVIEVLDKGHRPVVSLTHSRGVCWATPDHRFLTDGGFAGADSQDSRMYWDVLGLSKSARFYSQKSQKNEHEGFSSGDWRRVSQCGSLYGGRGVNGRSLHPQVPQLAYVSETPARGVSVSRWDCGRRRNNNHPNERQLRAAINDYFEHIHISQGVVGEARVHVENGYEHQRPTVLAHELERLQFGQNNVPAFAFSHNQSDSRAASLRVHHATTRTIEESAADGSYARNCLNFQMAERTQVTIGREGETHRVLDFVTEQHVFVAGGLLTHNCDHAINLLLKAEGFTLPEGGCCDEQYAGMSAEQIYNKLPQDSGEGGALAKMFAAAQGATGEVMPAGPADSAEAQEQAREWQENVAAAVRAAQSAGKLPAHVKRALGDTLAPRADWRAILRRFMTHHHTQRPTWSKRNKRFPHVYLPGNIKEGMGPVVIGVDTSGSIDAATLDAFAAEIRAIAADAMPAAVHVVYCDAAVNRADSFEHGEEVVITPCGGGGTAFEPVFEWVEENVPEVAALVYLTDGYGTFPSSSPEYPVLWTSVSPVGSVEYPWGEVVNI